MKQQFKKEFDEARTPKSDKPFWKIAIPIALLAALFAIALGHSSCNPAKKLAKAKETLSQNQKESAKYCAEKHPVKESTKIEYKYKTGKSVYLHDTSFVTVDCDSVIEKVKSGKVKSYKVIVKVPVYLQVDTAAIESVITQESIAAQIVLTNNIDSLKEVVKVKDEVITSKDKRIETVKTQRNCGWVGCGILIFAGILLIIGLVKGWFR